MNEAMQTINFFFLLAFSFSLKKKKQVFVPVDQYNFYNNPFILSPHINVL